MGLATIGLATTIVISPTVQMKTEGTSICGLITQAQSNKHYQHNQFADTRALSEPRISSHKQNSGAADRDASRSSGGNSEFGKEETDWGGGTWGSAPDTSGTGSREKLVSLTGVASLLSSGVFACVGDRMGGGRAVVDGRAACIATPTV